MKFFRTGWLGSQRDLAHQDQRELTDQVVRTKIFLLFRFSDLTGSSTTSGWAHGRANRDLCSALQGLDRRIFWDTDSGRFRNFHFNLPFNYKVIYWINKHR